MSLALLLPALALAAAPPPPEGLVRPLGGAEVDWAAGVIRAEGGSAADYRLPTAEIARAGAERRARAAATAQMRGALQALPVTGGKRLSATEIEAALGRCRTANVEYQSNGGAVLTLSLRFSEVTAEGDGKPPARVLAVAAMPLELAPRVVAGDGEVPLAWVVYRLGAPPGDAEAVAVKRDKEGRLVLPRAERPLIDKLARASAVIYVQKIVK